MRIQRLILVASATAACLASAYAQGSAAMCGDVVGRDVGWASGSREASDLSSLAEPIRSDVVAPIRGVYGAAFTMGAAGMVKFEVAASQGDAKLLILSPDGAVIGEDDDGAGGLDPRLIASLAPGDYCLAVLNLQDAPLIATVQSGLDRHASLPGLGASGATGGAAPACRIDDATPSLSDGALEAALARGPLQTNVAAAAASNFRFRLAEPQALMFTAEHGDGDPYLNLYDSSGYAIAQNDDFVGLTAVIQLQDPLPAGDYCLQVATHSPNGQPIRLTTQAYSLDAAMGLLHDAGQAPPTTGDTPINDLGTVTTPQSIQVPLGAKAQWVSFELSEPAFVTIETLALLGSDPALRLFSEQGAELAYSDDDGEGYNARVSQQLPAGPYYVAVLRVGGGGTLPAMTQVTVTRFVQAQ